MELLQKLYDMKKMSNSKVYKLLTGLKSPIAWINYWIYDSFIRVRQLAMSTL